MGVKRVLVVYYSQTGQLKHILDRLCAPMLSNSEVEVQFCNIKLKHQFPFPWNRKEFYGAMPDSVQEKSYELDMLPLENREYDLVILGYQPWFLSPSIPFTSFLKSSLGQQLVSRNNVLTVIGGRNMWVMAQESVKKTLMRYNSKLVGNIALMDRSRHLISVVTIVYWLFHNKKDRLLNVFPPPGVQEIDLNKTEIISQFIEKSVCSNDYSNLQSSIVSAGGVAIKPDVISMETKAKRVFKVWAGLINTAEKIGKPMKILSLYVFEFYLAFVILFLSPVVSIFSTFASIFRKKAIAKKMAYFSGVSLRE